MSDFLRHKRKYFNTPKLSTIESAVMDKFPGQSDELAPPPQQVRHRPIDGQDVEQWETVTSSLPRYSRAGWLHGAMLVTRFLGTDWITPGPKSS